MDTTGHRGVLISEVDCTQEVYMYAIGTSETVLIREVSLFQRCLLREVPL